MIKPKLLTASGGDTDLYIGEKEYLEAGEFEFQVPLGIRRIHVCCIGAGGGGSRFSNEGTEGGGGGALAWANNIEVEPGETLTVKVGSPAMSDMVDTGDSEVLRDESMMIRAEGGQYKNPYTGPASPQWGAGISGGGGQGGVAGNGGYSSSGGTTYGVFFGNGGGAGGYLGQGGSGQGGAPDAGSGGGSAGTTYYKTNGIQQGIVRGGEGGGVGIKGRGADGPSPGVQAPDADPRDGKPGSGGDGSQFGGGGSEGQGAGGGAVRIIWGIKFSYPDNADIEAVE